MSVGGALGDVCPRDELGRGLTACLAALWLRARLKEAEGWPWGCSGLREHTVCGETHLQQGGGSKAEVQLSRKPPRNPKPVMLDQSNATAVFYFGGGGKICKLKRKEKEKGSE